MAKTQRNIRFDDDLWGRLAKLATRRDTTVTDLVVRGAELLLEDETGASPTLRKRLAPIVSSTAQPTAREQEEAAGVAGVQRKAKDRCRRCTHAKASHWAKGCLAGCNCNLSRFMKEA